MIHEVDPLQDPRWPEFLSRHPCASVFHTAGWLRAVQETYGYQPTVLTTAGPGKRLENGVVFCPVHSWLTGRRLVSFPFSDHCEPLVENGCELTELLGGLEERARRGRYRYAELRPVSVSIDNRVAWQASEGFYVHRLDLRSGSDALFRRFHKSCIQRKITRAVAEGVEIRGGRTSETLEDFYALVVGTRRRQGLFPQPKAWFESVIRCLDDSVWIRCAYKDGKPIAGILTLQYGKRLYYKYGASEAQSHKFGAMPYLFWNAIQYASRNGLDELDMGRSERDNYGLVTFKDRWSAARSVLSYFRAPATARFETALRDWTRRLATRACCYVPDRFLTAFGSVAYRHLG